MGCGYLVVGWGNATLSNARPGDAQPLVTTRLLEWLGERTLDNSQAIYFTTVPVQLPPAPAAMTAIVAGQNREEAVYVSSLEALASAYSPLNSAVLAVDPQAMSRFMHIGHSLWAIVLGVAGGLLARAFFFRRERLAARAADV